MDSYLLEWVNLLLRWTHVIVVIAWIGSSFYFVFLDFSLRPPTDPTLAARGVSGELWAVHGGGFYNPQKYMVAPNDLPEHLHWFYWESYWTWMSGFALFVVLYLFNAGTFLVDARVHEWSATAAVASALVFLVVFWLVYDVICRVFARRARGDQIVGVLVALVVVVAAWLACHLFAGRAAFLITGAMIATAMTANVAMWIIPGQHTVVAQMRAGAAVDPIHGLRAKQRSVHNTYFTLPVLVAMLSNHYGWLYQADRNWLVLVVLMLAGALIRHSFVARHKALVAGVRVPWAYAGVGVLLIAALVAWQAPVRASGANAGGGSLSSVDSAPAPTVGSSTSAISSGRPAVAPGTAFAQVEAVVAQRCTLCHGAIVQQKNVRLDSPEAIASHAQEVYQQVVVLKQMPFNNATHITDDERALIARWFKAGAPIR